MITAQDILASLTANGKRIQAELKAEDWDGFCRELASLQEGFRDVPNQEALEKAVEPVWQVCTRYPVVRKWIQGVERTRRVDPGTAGDLPIREVANRFQSLLASLEPEQKSQPARQKEDKGSKLPTKEADHDQ